MIGLGVGIDYSLFIVTRFRESYARAAATWSESVVEAMDTSGRAILLAGATVVIALLGMFATGVAFMYGLAIAAVIAVLLDARRLADAAARAAVALRPRLVRPRRGRRGKRRESAAPPMAPARGPAPRRPLGVAAVERDRARRGRGRWRSSRWRVMIALLVPVFAMRLDSSDAGNDPANVSSRHAFDLLAQGFGQGFNGPLLLVAQLPRRRSGGGAAGAARLRPPPPRASSPSRSPRSRRRAPSP